MAHVRVFNHYIQSPFIILAFVELAVLMASAYAGVIWWGWTVPEGAIFGVDTFVLRYALLYGVIMLLATVSLGVYEAGVSESFASMAVRSLVSYCLLGSGALVLLFYAVPDFHIGRRPLFASVILSLCGVLLVRWFFYRAVDADGLKRQVLVLGAGKKAAAIAASGGGQSIGFNIVGYIPSPGEAVAVSEDELLDAFGGVSRLVDKYSVDEIIIAVDERRRDRGSYFPVEELLDCKMSGVRVTEAVKFYERELGRIELAEIHPGWMVFGDGFQYSLLRDVVKRVLDISAVVLLLLLAWPLMLLAVLAIAIETGRPVIYKQVRTGLNGKPFEIYKFRSMTKNAEKDGVPQWAQANDSRITRVGAFIRNTRIDELPQLWNVLKGEMSFVGPRPERPEFVSELKEVLAYYDFRHSVKPGLVGWAQLNYPYGASIEDAENKLVYDLYYVKNYSALLDILIVVQSVEIILLGKGVR